MTEPVDTWNKLNSMRTHEKALRPKQPHLLSAEEILPSDTKTKGLFLTDSRVKRLKNRATHVPTSRRPLKQTQKPPGLGRNRDAISSKSHDTVLLRYEVHEMTKVGKKLPYCTF